MAIPQEQIYTIKDIYSLPDGQRAELIDGKIYAMAPPNARHQEIIFSLSRRIADYIDRHGGDCRIYLAPYAVFLNADNKSYVEPDISVICNRKKLDDSGCHGAPDWIIEVASPGTERMDYGIKLFKYRSAGVREYWIIHPVHRTINIYDFEQNEKTGQYSFENRISSCIFQSFHVRIADFLERSNT